MVSNDCLYKPNSFIHKLNGSAGMKKNTIWIFVKLKIYRQKTKSNCSCIHSLLILLNSFYCICEWYRNILRTFMWTESEIKELIDFVTQITLSICLITADIRLWRDITLTFSHNLSLRIIISIIGSQSSIQCTSCERRTI